MEATPEIILALLIIAPTVYLSWYGLKPVARFFRLSFHSFLRFSARLLTIKRSG